MRRATLRTPLLGIAAVFAACVLVLFALAPNAFADEYGVSVAGTPVTSENAADVLAAAKDLNEQRAAQEAEAVVEDASEA